ncbi:36690_t:CDS:1, partial [Racocetra persica]
MIISAIKAYIDQNNEAQSNKISKLNERLELCFNQIQQTHQQQDSSTQQDKTSTPLHNHEFNTPTTKHYEKQNQA